MLRILDKDHLVEWNEIVKSFENWDVYYLYEYAYSFALHGDGEPLLCYFENNGIRLCYVIMQKDIAEFKPLAQMIKKGEYFDWETPYGYGGPLADGVLEPESCDLLKKELTKYCRENNIVSQFVRFHPLLENWTVWDKGIETRYLRDTIFMDISSPEVIWQNIESKNRNMIRKAQKNNVRVERAPIDDVEAFIPLYKATMEKNSADEYYIFHKDYFDSLKRMDKNVCLFYAMYENKVISAAIIFYNKKFMHYHLSGSDWEYRNLASSNFLLYEAAMWGAKNGIEKFHLGGGMAPDDSLFGFKKQFNRKERGKFVVGRTVFDEEKYVYLLKCRKDFDSEFNVNNSFMIQYRR